MNGNNEGRKTGQEAKNEWTIDLQHKICPIRSDLFMFDMRHQKNKKNGWRERTGKKISSM